MTLLILYVIYIFNRECNLRWCTEKINRKKKRERSRKAFICGDQ